VYRVIVMFALELPRLKSVKSVTHDPGGAASTGITNTRMKRSATVIAKYNFLFMPDLLFGLRKWISNVESLIKTTQAKVEINTAFIERLNATFRQRSNNLVQCSRSMARRPETPTTGMNVHSRLFL